MPALAAPCVFLHWSCTQRGHPEWKYNQRGDLGNANSKFPKAFPPWRLRWMKFLGRDPTSTLHKHSRAQGKAVQAERGILSEIQLISLILKHPKLNTSKALAHLLWQPHANFGWPSQDPLQLSPAHSTVTIVVQHSYTWWEGEGWRRPPQEWGHN